MSEIKSTIDLVMERTRDLTMTEEERRAALTNEWTGKARGWIQKYLDERIDERTLKGNLSAAEKEVPHFKELMKKELLDFLKLDADNDRILSLFEDLLGVSKDPIEGLMKDFLGEIEKERENREEAVQQELAGRGVSGSAVVANAARDKSWTLYLEEEKQRFSSALKEIKL